MKVHYQWSEDGETELCECETVSVEKEVSCYHCDRTIHVHETVVRLTAPDGGIYLLHSACAEKSCIK